MVDFVQQAWKGTQHCWRSLDCGRQKAPVLGLVVKQCKISFLLHVQSKGHVQSIQHEDMPLHS